MNKLPRYVRRFGRKFFFRFTLSEPRLTTAECYGITRNQFTQFASGQVENIDRNFETGTSRFPNSDRFETAEAASAECDLWLYRLHRDFSVPISRWSTGAPASEREPGFEYREFIRANLPALESHRASRDCPERKLQLLAEHGSPEQREQATAQLAKRASLNSFLSRVDVESVKSKSASLRRYFDLCDAPLRKLLEAADDPALHVAIAKLQESRLTVLAECANLIAGYEKLKH
jgi:hypothetical protein